MDLQDELQQERDINRALREQLYHSRMEVFALQERIKELEQQATYKNWGKQND